MVSLVLYQYGASSLFVPLNLTFSPIYIYYISETFTGNMAVLEKGLCPGRVARYLKQAITNGDLGGHSGLPFHCQSDNFAFYRPIFCTEK